MDNPSKPEDVLPESMQEALIEEYRTHHHFFKVVGTGQGTIRYCKFCGESFILAFLGGIASRWERIKESEQ